MTEKLLAFNGSAQIYLQGTGALQVMDSASEDYIEYQVGASSDIRVRDFRCQPVNYVKRILAGENGDRFADIFNQPAFVKVYSEEDAVEIDINDNIETKQDGDKPTLWLGVTVGNEIPAYPMFWWVFKPTGEQNFSFAALFS